ncbi:hypothetical protein [uncultured Pseudomonas sp.]|uniref:hypothetical protein n=1 Tax=uncultured Pseudomonas sp. TaxID=114707 RepID=UPI002586A050|nr:hypothetical protein [uncultured Pseudomonas sp.]
MKLTELQVAFAKEIVGSWTAARSNYIVVTPPMSGDRAFSKYLGEREFLYEVHGDDYSKYRVAIIDAADYKNDIQFAISIARAWKVKDGLLLGDEDAGTILERSCDWVVRENLVPVLIVQRFHEAIERLGENVGASLRNLEHDYFLKTIVTMPVKLQTLRERWEVSQKGTVPFLASDWGQGHSAKILPGYSRSELERILKAQGGCSVQAETIFNATGGVKDIVDRLIDEVGSKKGRGLVQFLRSRSGELCERLIKWIESPTGTHSFKKSLVSIISPQLYSANPGLISSHEWASIILNKSGMLVFEMLAWASHQELAKSQSHSWLPGLLALIKSKDLTAARALIFISEETEKNALYEHWRAVAIALDFSMVGDKLFSSDVNWLEMEQGLCKLRAMLAELNVWDCSFELPFQQWGRMFKLLDSFKLDSATTNTRFEDFVCNQIPLQDLGTVFQLWRARLDASKAYEAYQRHLSVVTIPESVMQVYSYFRHGIQFWNYQGLAADEDKRFKRFVKYDYNLPKGRLGYTDLVHLIAFLSVETAETDALLGEKEVVVALGQYETRKTFAHSTAFASLEGCEAYHRFCEKLLEDTQRVLPEKPSSLDTSMFTLIACNLIGSISKMQRFV